MIILSVVCPVYNEENFIQDVIEFFLSAEPKEKELYIIDGGSTDRTVEIAKQYKEKHSSVHIIFNPDKYVPYALNKAIPRCAGQYIVRLDAHTRYDADYFNVILDTFKKTNASIVGGPMIAVGTTATQQAVAYATSTKLGVGNSDFHFASVEGEVDSVYLGAWKKSIFETTGLFDTRFHRNQDDEFHYRAKSKGFIIWQNPKIRSYYYPRDSLQKLGKQYYQYGLYKPMVLAKIKGSARLRHLIPSFFVLYIMFLPLATLVTKGVVLQLYLLPLIAYSVLNFWFSFKCPYPVHSKCICLLAYPVLHVCYGFGFLLGLRKISK